MIQQFPNCFTPSQFPEGQIVYEFPARPSPSAEKITDFQLPQTLQVVIPFAVVKASANYILQWNITNDIDTDQVILSFNIVDKQVDQVTLLFNTPPDSDNYFFNAVVQVIP